MVRPWVRKNYVVSLSFTPSSLRSTTEQKRNSTFPVLSLSISLSSNLLFGLSEPTRSIVFLQPPFILFLGPFSRSFQGFLPTGPLGRTRNIVLTEDTSTLFLLVVSPLFSLKILYNDSQYLIYGKLHL